MMRSFPLSATNTEAGLAVGFATIAWTAGTAPANQPGMQSPSEIRVAATATTKKIAGPALREVLRFMLVPDRRWLWPESVPPHATVRYWSPPGIRKARRREGAVRRVGGSWPHRERVADRSCEKYATEVLQWG